MHNVVNVQNCPFLSSRGEILLLQHTYMPSYNAYSNKKAYQLTHSFAFGGFLRPISVRDGVKKPTVAPNSARASGNKRACLAMRRGNR